VRLTLMVAGETRVEEPTLPVTLPPPWPVERLTRYLTEKAPRYLLDFERWSNGVLVDGWRRWVLSPGKSGSAGQ
jgi:hypothetical protein